MDYNLSSNHADDYGSVSHPNVLLIITDQQQKKTISSFGGKTIETPGIDKIAENGMLFTRAYTTCPLCAPARSSLFSGMHISRSGVPVNDDDARMIQLDDSIVSFSDVFKNFGYKCGYFGKWHIGRESMPQHGFFDGWFVHLRNSYENWLERNNMFNFPEDVKGLSRRGLVPFELAHDTVCTDKAIQFMKNSNKDTPFLCVCSLRAPHDPYIGPFDNYLDPEGVETPENYYDDLKTKPFHQRISWAKKIAEKMNISNKNNLNRIIAQYFGLVKLVDKNIERLLETLDSLKLTDNTIIMFVSDHGDMMGSHGLMMKGPFMYEETNNIPFAISYPNVIPQGISNELISMVDCAPTLLEYAGLPVPKSMEGRSLKQLIDQIKNNKSISWRDKIISESYESYSQRCPIWNITTKQWKYNYYFGDIDELYNLDEDPLEMNNLAQDDAYRYQLYELREKLADWSQRNKSFDLTDLLELNHHCISPGIDFKDILTT